MRLVKTLPQKCEQSQFYSSATIKSRRAIRNEISNLCMFTYSLPFESLSLIQCLPRQKHFSAVFLLQVPDKLYRSKFVWFSPEDIYSFHVAVFQNFAHERHIVFSQVSFLTWCKVVQGFKYTRKEFSSPLQLILKFSNGSVDGRYSRNLW